MYRLVIVDDEEKITEGIANLFPWEELGFEVVRAYSKGSDALAYIQNNSVDVLLSDIEMPDVNGIELCAQIQEKDVKVVFISSYQKYEYLRSAILYQVEDYLLKPIKFEELRKSFTKIREKLDKERGLNPEELTDNETYYEKIISQVKNYIVENYRDCTLEDAALQVNLSAGYLSKIFKEKSGKGFQDYLVDCRMQKACELLDDIQFKSYEVAHYIGYSNPKNFSRAFKAYYGKTPNEYRNSK
ncbi:MAG TPA: response regulator [Epulopiscium sp.]|nr:response regulator [Candidatus Epulonipiscium sp.]